MKRQYLHRHHRKTILVTGIIGVVSAIMVGITDMLLNANATSGAEIFAVETYELMANKTPQQLMWGSLGGIFILVLMAGYWHWYAGMATVHRWWSSLTLLLLLIGAIGGTLYHFYVATPGLAYQTLFQITDGDSYRRIEELIQIYDRDYSQPTFLMAMVGFAGGSVLFFIPTYVAKPLSPVGMRLVFRLSPGHSRCSSRVSSRHPSVALLGLRGTGPPLLPLLSQLLY